MKQSSRKLILFFLTCILLIVLDRSTKMLAKKYLMDREPVSWIHDSIRLEYAENTGAFLSLGDNWPPAWSFWVLGVMPLVLLSVFLIYILRKTRDLSFFQLTPWILIFSGGLGNILDRLMYDRHVTDFLNLGINNLRTGIFNLADLYVTTGLFLWLWESISHKKADNPS